jgi:hypothetical protein
MTISTWLPLNNALAAPLVSYGPDKITCPWVNIPLKPGSGVVLTNTVGLVPIYPLPGNAGTGSWAISLFWTLPLVPLMAKLFLLSALGMR